MNVRANHVADFDACTIPGDFFLSPSAKGERRLSFFCPCGCGALAGIRVRDDGLETARTWAWNRNEEKPTCTPSIRIDTNHWHGYLTNGEFIRTRSTSKGTTAKGLK
jgi:hypothetical protein